AVDGDGDQVGRHHTAGVAADGGGHRTPPASAHAVARAGSNGQPAPSRCAAYSSRKYFSEDMIGLAAPSPRAQNDLPRMLSLMSSSLSRSAAVPPPCSMRSSSWTSQ